MERFIVKGLACLLGLFSIGTLQALPMLQIDVLGGSYDPVNEDVYGSDSLFTLYAYGKIGDVDTSATHYLSAAISPQTSAGTNIGSFSIDGNSYDSSDMTYGTPPIEQFDAIQGSDSGDLPTHSIFDTLFLELAFNWDLTQTRSGVNTQDNPGTNPLAFPGNDLYWYAWNIDLSGLAANTGLHFDLYTLESLACGNNLKNSFGGSLPSPCSDVDIIDKAPFSHDATVNPRKPPTPLTSSVSSLATVFAGAFGLSLGFLGTRGRRLRLTPTPGSPARDGRMQ